MLPVAKWLRAPLNVPKLIRSYVVPVDHGRPTGTLSVTAPSPLVVRAPVTASPTEPAVLIFIVPLR